MLRPLRWLIGCAALLAITLSIWQLESDRAAVQIAPLDLPGGPPATLFLSPAPGPVPTVVIAHGFAGSRPLMDSFALHLAQAGYLVVSFDFMGHGRNPVPMSGDVTTIDGTTRLMVDELRRVAQAALAHPRADGRLAYLGHSMASDLVIRAALEDPKAQAVVAISAFSQAVTATDPANLLIINGAWEAPLRQEARRVIALTDAGASEGSTVGDMAAGTARRAVAAPNTEHVGVLYSTTSQAEALAWLDAAFGHDSGSPAPLARGGWIVLLLTGLVALVWPLAAAIPAAPSTGPKPMPARLFLICALGPMLAVPLVLWPFEIRVLPVLVADYLALHFALYGLLTLALLAWQGQLEGRFAARVWPVGVALGLGAVLVFGLALDRYVASFLPHPGRMAVIAGLALGAVPFCLGDALLTEGGRARPWRVLVARLGFLTSLALAVALNFEALFFLVIILPLVLIYFLIFGMMAGWLGRRMDQPAALGIGLGLMLAWSLGVTFPMFAG